MAYLLSMSRFMIVSQGLTQEPTLVTTLTAPGRATTQGCQAMTAIVYYVDNRGQEPGSPLTGRLSKMNALLHRKSSVKGVFVRLAIYSNQAKESQLPEDLQAPSDQAFPTDRQLGQNLLRWRANRILSVDGVIVR